MRVRGSLRSGWMVMMVQCSHCSQWEVMLRRVMVVLGERGDSSSSKVVEGGEDVGILPPPRKRNKLTAIRIRGVVRILLRMVNHRLVNHDGMKIPPPPPVPPNSKDVVNDGMKHPWLLRVHPVVHRMPLPSSMQEEVNKNGTKHQW